MSGIGHLDRDAQVAFAGTERTDTAGLRDAGVPYGLNLCRQ
jgi:hypothetical protein